MPRRDLESPSNNGDGALETLEAEEEEKEEEEEDPEMPPESFRIGIGDELDWAELNAVLDRDDSTRGSANPKSQQQQQLHHHNHHHHANPSKPRSDDSQRFSGIIVLPGAIPISGAYLGRSARRARRKKVAGNGGGNGGSAVPETETDPGSPKVSCAGRVMSQRDRRRNPRIIRRSPEDEDNEDEEERGGRRGGFVAAALRRFCGAGGASPSENIPALVAAPPGLGGMRRFPSRRRGDYSYGGDPDGGMYCHVALSRPRDREIVAGNSSVGPFEETGRDRD